MPKEKNMTGKEMYIYLVSLEHAQNHALCKVFMALTKKLFVEFSIRLQVFLVLEAVAPKA